MRRLRSADRWNRLTAVRPVPRAVPVLEGDRDYRLGLVRVVDRVAARGLRGRLPGGLHELEGAAEHAAVADGLGVAARLAFGGRAGPAAVGAGDLGPEGLVLRSCGRGVAARRGAARAGARGAG